MSFASCIYEKTMKTVICLCGADFLFYGGVVFLISTTLVAVFKRESERGQGKKRAKETQGVVETYKLLFSIIKLPTVLSFCTLLLTAKVPPHHPSRVPLTTHCTLSVAPHGPLVGCRQPL